MLLSKKYYTIFIYLLLVSCTSTVTNQVKEQFQFLENLKTDTVVLENQKNRRIDECSSKIIEFNTFADSVLQSALGNDSLSLTLNSDTTLITDSTRQIYYDRIFYKSSLKEIVESEFSLPSPFRRYSFRLYSYEYTSPKEAKLIYDKYLSISSASRCMYIKAPNQLFLNKNKLMWLLAPHSISGKTFNSLISKLNALFSEFKQRRISSKKVTKVPLVLRGEKQLKYYCPVQVNDTSKAKDFSTIRIKFDEKSILVDNVSYPVDFVWIYEVPDAVNYFLFKNQVYLGDDELASDQLQKLTGSLTVYKVSYKNHNMKHFGFSDYGSLSVFKTENNILLVLKNKKLYRLNKIIQSN